MTKALALAVGVALLCAAFASAAVEEVFSAADGNRVRDSINAAQKDGWWGNARKTHYAVASLKALDAPVAQRDKVCAALSKALNAKDATVEEVYHAVAAIESVACDSAIPESAKAAISKGLAADSLESILFGLQAIEAAAPRKRLNFDDFDVSNVAARVMELAEDDDTGLFRPNSDADDANAVNAGRAMSVLGAVYKARHELDNSLAAHVRSVSGDKLKTLLTQGTAKGVDFGAGSDVSGLVAASTVLQGVNALATALSEQLDVPEYAMDDVCDFLVENKYAASLEDVYFLLSGLNICADNTVRVPLVLTVAPAAKAGDAPSQVRVTNVLDAFATKAKVVLTKAQTDSDDDDAATTTVAENLELAAGSSDAKNVLYTIAPAGGKAWAPNFYLLKFTVTPAADSERFGQERISKRVKVAAAYAPSKVELFTSETAKGAAEGKTESVAYPSSGPTVSAAAGKFFQAKVHFAPASSRPAQVFFILTPLSADAKDAKGKSAGAAAAAGNRKQSIHVATNSAGDDFYALRLDLGSAEVADSLSGNGKYMVELFVGDALLPKPVVWTVATLELSGLSGTGKAGAAAGAVDWFAPKADIAHAFRPAEDRPSKLLALVFTGLVVLPLVSLLSQLMGWKLNLALPTDALEASATFVFQSLLLATLLTMVVYWLGLNIFQALVMLAVLAPFTVFFGHRSLKLLHARKLKDRAAQLQAAAATGVAAAAPLS